MSRKGNLIWILIGALVLGVLIFISKDDYIIPHSKLKSDSVTSFDEKSGGGYGGGDPEMSYEPASLKEPISEDFLGKSFSKCMQIVYDWPDGKIYDVNDGHDGNETINFKVNNKHHELFFQNGICVEDNIIKN
jgi:hypothetical protein